MTAKLSQLSKRRIIKELLESFVLSCPECKEKLKYILNNPNMGCGSLEYFYCRKCKTFWRYCCIGALDYRETITKLDIKNKSELNDNFLRIDGLKAFLTGK
jgi:uncharacterized protein YbaR (Trm112 family)